MADFGGGFFGRISSWFRQDEPDAGGTSAEPLQGGKTVVEHPDLATRLDVDPRIDHVPEDHGDTLPDDVVHEDTPEDELPQIDGPPPPPDLTGGLDAHPDIAAGRSDVRLDLDLEPVAPFDPPDPGPALDLDPDALGGGLDAPTVSPDFDLDPLIEPSGDLDDLA